MTTAASAYRQHVTPDNVEQARHRKAMRGPARCVMHALAPGAPLEEVAAYLEAQQTERDYMATYRETYAMHPLVTALSEYRAVTQALHGRMEYTRLHGDSSLYADDDS
ncbi:hypothetical protein E6R60_26610 [Streptomyces sp. A0642]|uniref:hypothetical protein n=1 Tax=Streptomyces sp. A0642 TaxID=2563100 RepID=UPI0010A28418|nr:hypothetical protein [Streptomyces sp. A0642]THA72505.1 hypothetical protein E6R60_26610 [Streptomyces sp. A0642]